MKLKPCPFCGGRKESLRVLKNVCNDGKTISGWRVVCEPPEKPCGAEGPITATKEKSQRAWNRRAQ